MIERRCMVAGLLLAVTAAAGCGPRPGPDPTGPVPLPSTDELREEILSTQCDTEAFRDLADRVVQAHRENVRKDGEIRDMPPEAAFLVSTGNLNNNQMHDCQRLAMPRDTPGTLMAQRPLVAILPSESAVQATASSFREGVVVADIINYDAFGYEPLGIPPGLSCLWLRSGDAGWEGAIRRPVDGRCSGAQTGARIKTLDVVRHQVRKAPQGFGTPRDLMAAVDARQNAARSLPMATAADYPHVGRWMWDRSTRTPFIGIQCGDGWCEMGARTFDCASTGLVTHLDVPGWFDTQYLSVPGPKGALVLSDVWGRIEPGKDNRKVEQRLPENWPYEEEAERAVDGAHVATLIFEGGHRDARTFYFDRFALAPDRSEHRVYFKTDPGFWLWDQPYQFRSENSQWKRVRRCNLSHSGTGTARWAWSDDDEGFWVPCDAGCCVVRGFEH